MSEGQCYLYLPKNQREAILQHAGHLCSYTYFTCDEEEEEEQLVPKEGKIFNKNEAGIPERLEKHSLKKVVSRNLYLKYGATVLLPFFNNSLQKHLYVCGKAKWVFFCLFVFGYYLSLFWWNLPRCRNHEIRKIWI